jgi:hypothetical protein
MLHRLPTIRTAETMAVGIHPRPIVVDPLAAPIWDQRRAACPQGVMLSKMDMGAHHPRTTTTGLLHRIDMVEALVVGTVQALMETRQALVKIDMGVLHSHINSLRPHGTELVDTVDSGRLARLSLRLHVRHCLRILVLNNLRAAQMHLLLEVLEVLEAMGALEVSAIKPARQRMTGTAAEGQATVAAELLLMGFGNPWIPCSKKKRM